MDQRAAVRQIGFARQLPDEVVDALSASAGRQVVERGAIITMEGEPAEAMYLVAAGRVKIMRHSAEGREQIIHVAQAGDHFNTVPIFDGGPCPATTEAAEETTLLVLRREVIFDLSRQYPELCLALLREFSGRLRGMLGLVEDLALHTVHGRLAHLLLQQAEAAERGEGHKPLTQAEMAAHIGTVREMVGRALKSFEAAGLISVERGVVTIQDRERLREQATM